MDVAISLNDTSLTKNQIKEYENKVKDDSKFIIFKMFQTILDEEGIEYDHSITDIKGLKKSINKSITKEQKNKIEMRLNNSKNDVIELVNAIKKETNSTLGNFLNLSKENIVEPLSKKATFLITSGAIYSAITMLPTPIRTITGITGISGMIYKGSKKMLERHVAKQAKRYDNILRRLSESTDENGKLIDTRFKREEIECIDTFFKNMGQKLDTSNYQKMEEQIKSLNNTKKFELIKAINSFKGNPINISEEIKNEKKNEKIEMLKRLGIGIGAGVTVGSQVGVAINTLDESIVPGAINTVATKLALNKVVKNNIVENIGAAIAGVGTKLATFIPFVGDGVSKALAAETIAVTSLSGMVAGLTVSSVKEVFFGTKKIIKEMKELLEDKRHKNKDEKMYGDSENLTDNQKMIMNIVYKFFEEKNIPISEKPQNLTQVKALVGDLSQENKEELNFLMGIVGKAMKEKGTSEKAKEVWNLLSTSFCVGATGVAIKDVIDFATSHFEEPEVPEEIINNGTAAKVDTGIRTDSGEPVYKNVLRDPITGKVNENIEIFPDKTESVTVEDLLNKPLADDEENVQALKDLLEGKTTIDEQLKDMVEKSIDEDK